MARAFLRRTLALVLPIVALGCTDNAKKSAERARVQAEELSVIAASDVDELRRGMPPGAAAVAKTLYGLGTTGPVEPSDVRKSLRRIRSTVPDLRTAKSTFMALATVDGLGIRSDLEEDRIAGIKLFDVFKGLDLARATAAGQSFATTIGTFDAAGGPVVDDDFAAMVPVMQGTELKAYLLSGWTFRSFARHLQAQAEQTMVDKRKTGAETEKAPVLYVAIRDSRGTFGSPTTPKVNLDTIQAMDATKVSPGSTGVLEIEGRVFAWGSAKAPALGENVAIVVLRSDL